MESTRKKKTPVKNYERLSRSFEHPDNRALLGRKGLTDFESHFDEYTKEDKTDFLIDVFDSVFGYDRETGEKVDTVNITIDFNNEDNSEVTLENPLKDKRHVYYNSHYYIELVPSEWVWSEPGEEFFEQQLENIKSIRPSYTRDLDKDLEEKEKLWRQQGFVTVSISEVGYRPGYCRYCGKRISPLSEKIEVLEGVVNGEKVVTGVVEIFPKDFKERSTPGRNKEYCDDGVCKKFKKCENPKKYTDKALGLGGNSEYCNRECPEYEVLSLHKKRQRRVEKYYEELRIEGKLTPQLIELHDKYHICGLDLERIIRPNRRCVVCGGVIPDDKPLDPRARYCDGVCKRFKTCNNPKKYTIGGLGEGGNNEYCVRECPEREVVKDHCKDVFKNRLKKERATHPNITDEELIEILKKERTGGKIRKLKILALKEYLKIGVDPYDEAYDSECFGLRVYFKEEYPLMIARLREEIEKEKNQK